MFTNFNDPNENFLHVSDVIVWGKLFFEPYPVDINDVSKGQFCLSRYFKAEVYDIDTRRGYFKERIFVSAKKAYRNLPEKLKNKVFLTLCNFINKYKRGYRECVLNIPHHESMEINQEYDPYIYYSKIPLQPEINENNMLVLDLKAEMMGKIYQYYYGKPMQSVEGGKMLFSPNCFCGFMLQYKLTENFYVKILN